jgi:hypothetical protein
MTAMPKPQAAKLTSRVLQLVLEAEFDCKLGMLLPEEDGMPIPVVRKPDEAAVAEPWAARLAGPR